MKDKFLRKHFGFTLPEVIIAITIMGVMAAAVTMSSNVGKQTAKAEAEKVAADISRLLKTADRIHDGIVFTVEDDDIIHYRWNSLPNTGNNPMIPTELNDNENKVIMYNFNARVFTGNQFIYNAEINSFNNHGGSILITRNDDASDRYYIIFAETSGRVRASANPSED